MISPTVGRVVLFYPGRNHPHITVANAETPVPALVARVWSDSMINVGGFDVDGKPFGATSVTLCQDESDTAAAKASGMAYAEWMPYQKGQAAKTEAAEKAAEAVGGGTRTV